MGNEIEVEKIAKLARLKLTEEEISKFEKDLEEVKEMFDEIDKIEVKESPCFQPVEVKNVTREDKVKKGFSLEEAFSNAEHKERNFFKGPKV
jgi:aspartyl-tRNA(Asn)/glutamyl-tRNA(Gln) amidotransferase subunit C